MISYTGIPDGTVNLSVRADQGAGTELGSTTAQFEADTDYTAYVVGGGPSAPVVFARDTNFVATSLSSRCVQIVDLLETTDTHHYVVYKNGEIFFLGTNDRPVAGGFYDISRNAADSITVALTDGTGTVKLSSTYTIKVGEGEAVSVVMYGAPSAPKFLALKGVWSGTLMPG